MLTLRARLVIASVTLALGIMRISSHDTLGWVFFIGGVLVLVNHFLYGPIWLAFRALQRGQVDKAKRLVGSIRYPRFLTAQSRAYLSMIKGIILSDKGNLEDARQHLEAAFTARLRTPNDRSLVACQIAELARRRGAREGALRYLRLATELPHKVELNGLIARVEKALNAEA